MNLDDMDAMKDRFEKAIGMKPMDIEDFSDSFNEQKEILHDAYLNYSNKQTFKPGDIIYRKSIRYSGVKFPQENQPAVFIEYVDIIKTEDHGGSPIEKYDCICGIIGPDGKFRIFEMPSWIFRK